MINKKSVPIILSFTALRKQLMTDYNYTRQEVVHTLWRLINATDEVKDAFVGWYRDRRDPQLECEGITWHDMVDEKGLNPFNAFLFMDTLIKDPSLGVNLLPAQVRPSLQSDVDSLRPELRDYVLQQQKRKKSPLMGVYVKKPIDDPKEPFDPADGDEIKL